MAWISEADSSSYVNVATNVGGEIRNVSRNGTTVSFQYRAYIYQSTSTWSNNTWALWVEGDRNVVKNSGTHSSRDTKYYTEWYSKTVSLATNSSYTTVSVGVAGKNFAASSPNGYVTLEVNGLPTASAPSLSGLSISNVSDKSAKASFNINNTNNASVTDSYIDLSLSNWGSVVKTISSRSGTFTGLDPNRTYYARGNAANAAGRSYTSVSSFETTFVNPGAPGKPNLSYDQPEPIPRAKITGSWNAGTAGSTAVAGYRVRLYKNGTQVEVVDTDSADTSYTFPKTLEEYGFEPGDVLAIGIYAYSKDWQGTKFFNGGGASTAIVMSDNLTIVSDKYIWVSVNGQSFNKHKMYVSINGGSFQEVRKEKFKVIK
jgi:hypothetical protein